MTVTVNGYLPFQQEISVSSGNNPSWIIANLQEEAGLPQSQDLTGRVFHQIGQSVPTYPFSTVYVTNSSTGAVTSIETDENASWVFPDAPLYPTVSAITTTNVSSNIVVYHEVKQAIGFQQVAWGPDYDESVMETPVQNYSQEDITISKLVSTYYYDAYQNNTHGVPLSYLTPGVSKSTKEKATPQKIEFDNTSYHFK